MHKTTLSTILMVVAGITAYPSDVLACPTGYDDCNGGSGTDICYHNSTAKTVTCLATRNGDDVAATMYGVTPSTDNVLIWGVDAVGNNFCCPYSIGSDYELYMYGGDSADTLAFSDPVYDLEDIVGKAYGNADADTLRSSPASSATCYLYGEGGNDTIYGRGETDNIWGGSENDVIYGMGGIDYLYGDSGDDVIYAGTGIDQVDGGADDDIIHGDAGNDTIYGGDGNDTITGDGDDDTIYGGDGADTIRGNDNDDIIQGGDDNDFLLGNDGVDLICGGDCTADGGDGDDKIDGGAGEDELYGEDGADTICGGDDPDTIDGGEGDDSLWGGSDAVETLIDGWYGTDDCEVDGSEIRCGPELFACGL